MKKKLIAVLILIAIFIPTYFAIAYYVSAQNAPVAERTIEKLTLSTLDGKKYVFDKKSDESKDMISFFVDMNDGAKQVSELPDQLKGSKYYEGVYRCFNKNRVYKYYFNGNPNEAYYVDARNKTYSIDPAIAMEFLSMNYAESTYSSSIEPELTVSNMKVLEPYNMDWKYKACNGKFINSSYSGKKEDSAEFPVSGSLQLSFTNQPDYITVKILHGDKVVFDDIYENLTSAIIGETTKTYKIEVNAKWYETSDKEYHGEAKYVFSANVSAPASFYLGEDTIEHGEFVALSGKNIVDINAITFKSEPEINYTPKFYQVGDYAVALIPISIANDYSPSYVFTISSGGVTEELTLTVTERAKKGAISYDASAELVNRTRTAATLDAFTNAMKRVVEKNENTLYFKDTFAEPVPRSIRIGFGRTRTITSTGTSYVHTGVDYVVTSKDQVCATNAGKVVYVGEQIVSGKLVVIDHGLGIKSWYMHMSDISVKVGDVVEKGAVLGVVGNTGFTTTYNLHYELTVHGVSVNPYSLWDDGVKMQIGQ